MHDGIQADGDLDLEPESELASFDERSRHLPCLAKIARFPGCAEAVALAWLPKITRRSQLAASGMHLRAAILDSLAFPPLLDKDMHSSGVYFSPPRRSAP